MCLISLRKESGRRRIYTIREFSIKEMLALCLCNIVTFLSVPSLLGLLRDLKYHNVILDFRLLWPFDMQSMKQISKNTLCGVVLQDKEDSGHTRSSPTADLGPVVLGRVMQWRTAPVWSAHRGWMLITLFESVFVWALTKIRHGYFVSTRWQCYQLPFSNNLGILLHSQQKWQPH